MYLHAVLHYLKDLYILFCRAETFWGLPKWPDQLTMATHNCMCRWLNNLASLPWGIHNIMCHWLPHTQFVQNKSFQIWSPSPPFEKGGGGGTDRSGNCSRGYPGEGAFPVEWFETTGHSGQIVPLTVWEAPMGATFCLWGSICYGL